MDNFVNLDIDKICRVCLQTNPCLSSLFVEQPNGVSLPHMILQCTNYEVCRGDAFPQLICSDCMGRTQSAYNFRMLYESSHRTLTALLVSVRQNTQEDLKPNVSNVACFQIKTEELMETQPCGFSVKLENEETEPIVKTEIFDTGNSVMENDELIIKEENASDVDTDSEESNMSSEMPDEDASKDQEPSGTSNGGEQELALDRMKFEKGDNSIRETNEIEKSIYDKSFPKSRGIFHCTYCNKEFRQKCLLRRHLVAHLSETPYHCVVCQKKFKTQPNLKDHIANHGGPFQCEFCERSFGKEWLLKRHKINAHENEPTNKRSPAGAGFYNTTLEPEYNIQAYSLTSPEEESNTSFQCSQCYKAFKRKQHLKIHLATHLEVTPFQCPLCERKFKRQTNLDVHIANHGGQYECKLCNRSYGKGWLLKRHNQRTHPNLGLEPEDVKEKAK